MMEERRRKKKQLERLRGAERGLVLTACMLVTAMELYYSRWILYRGKVGYECSHGQWQSALNQNPFGLS